MKKNKLTAAQCRKINCIGIILAETEELCRQAIEGKFEGTEPFPLIRCALAFTEMRYAREKAKVRKAKGRK